jgi:hypothetical protein
MKEQLFHFAILWHPTEKQIKDDGAKSKVVVEPKTILAADIEAVKMAAAMEIPSDYKTQLSQIQIAVRPF